jgi:integrase
VSALQNWIRDSQLKPVTLWAVLKNTASVFSRASLQAMGLTGLQNPFARLVRPKVDREAFQAPPADTLKGKRDRAILSTVLYHGVRCDKVIRLKVEDIHSRRGVPRFRVHGIGGKVGFGSAHRQTLERINDYLTASGHQEGALCRPVKNPHGGLERPLSRASVYHQVVKHYAKEAGIAAWHRG